MVTAVIKRDLEVRRGATTVFRISGTLDGSAVTWNTGGYTLKLLAKWSEADDDASAAITLSTGNGKIVATPTNFTITFSPTDFSSLPYYDHRLKYELRFYDGSKSHSIFGGDLFVKGNIVRATS